MKLRNVAVTAALFGLAATASAKSLVEQHIDSVINNTHIIVAGNPAASGRPDAETTKRIYAFYLDQFRHSQDPEAPYFLLMSKERNLIMGIGGVVRMRGWYDWHGAMPVNGFTPYYIPMTPDPTDPRHIGSTPAGTCLFFRVLGNARYIGDYQLYIEANFNGWNGRDFHLKKAYAILGDVTVGYASSTFSDPAAVPSTVDASGPNNKLDHTTVLVRYMPNITKDFSVAVSAEMPSNSIGADGVNTKAVSCYIPDFAAMAQYSWAPTQHVRLSGVVRSLPYRDLVTPRNYDKIGWGVQLSSVNHPCDAVTTYITANYGAGYAGMGGDLLSGAYDLISDPANRGKLYAPKSFGWNLAVQYNFRHNLFMTVSASQNRFLPSERISPDEYKYGIMGSVNVFWNPLPRFQVGAEYDLGRRKNFSGQAKNANRFGLMAQVSF